MNKKDSKIKELQEEMRQSDIFEENITKLYITQIQKKDCTIRELQEKITQLRYEVDDLEGKLITQQALDYTVPTTKKKLKYGGAISFDYWPPSDWFRFSFSAWNPGKYLQIAIGPFRLDFWQE